MPGVLPALCVGGEDADAALGWRWECLQLSNGFPEATIQVWSFIGDGMAVKGKRRGMIAVSYTHLTLPTILQV